MELSGKAGFGEDSADRNVVRRDVEVGEGGEAPPSKSKDKIRTFYPEMNKTFESIYIYI